VAAFGGRRADKNVGSVDRTADHRFINSPADPTGRRFEEKGASLVSLRERDRQGETSHRPSSRGIAGRAGGVTLVQRPSPIQRKRRAARCGLVDEDPVVPNVQR